jgi:outer membrane protein TolC
MRNFILATAILGSIFITGCTVHPIGERKERASALATGKPFLTPTSQRLRPDLPAKPTPDDLVRYALLTSPELEQRYWEWRSAIEQIPQDGTPETTLAINAASSITRGRTGLADTVLTAQNMPSVMIPWPGKLTAAARRALENARAAGLRFRKARFDLRAKVLVAWDDYALNAELIRLEQADAALLRTTVMVVEARNRSGAGRQQDLLKARNELDLSRNDIAAMQAQLPVQRAALNALLDRAPEAPIPVPSVLATTRPILESDAQLLALAARQNPGLAVLSREIAGRRQGIELARLQYFPDFAVGASSDLAGVTQGLMGMFSVPLLRHEAINAAIAQAQANLRASEAMRRQAHNDLNAQVVLDISTLRDADRQLDLFDHTLLPRARQVVNVARSAYEAGQASLLDWLDSERSLIAIERLVANLRIAREKRLADLEAIATVEFPVRENGPTP